MSLFSVYTAPDRAWFCCLLLSLQLHVVRPLSCLNTQSLLLSVPALVLEVLGCWALH